MNLLEAVEGRRSEDLATQVLLILLQSPEFREVQKLFFQAILRDGLLLSTEDRRFRVTTQQADKKLGRPDLTIDGEDVLILIENKFSALFSPNQLYRYSQILDEAGKHRSVLVLVCPKHHRKSYELDIIEQFRTGDETSNTIEELQAQLQKKRIHLVVLTWEELLRILDSSHFLVGELAAFVRDRFLTHVQFVNTEVQRIMSTEIPELLNRVLNLVDRVKGEIAGGHIETRRSSQSIKYYGFGLGLSNTSFYFGYMFDWWIKFKTPLFVQVSPTWDGNGHLTEEVLVQAGFSKEAENNYLFPIRIADGEENVVLAVVVSQIQSLLERVTTKAHATNSSSG